jgi:apolipoprotein D and lipocalin family protein
MKPLLFALGLFAIGAMPLLAAMTFENQPLAVLEPQRFEGKKWYSLMSIPTPLDKNWRETAESYTPRKGGYDVHTVYRLKGETRWREISSRLFAPKHGPQGALKAQFWWPFKVDYSILAIAPDGSWMVGGHPKKKMLFILSRTPSLPEATLKSIIQRCRELGYPVEKLTSQEHRP